MLARASRYIFRTFIYDPADFQEPERSHTADNRSARGGASEQHACCRCHSECISRETQADSRNSPNPSSLPRNSDDVKELETRPTASTAGVDHTPCAPDPQGNGKKKKKNLSKGKARKTATNEPLPKFQNGASCANDSSQLAQKPHGLPVEIYARIFDLVLFGYGPYSESTQDELIALGLVCRRWRDVTLSIPRFWANVAFDLVGTKTEEADIVRRCTIWFARAKSLPLTVEICPNKHCEDGSILWTYLATLKTLKSMRISASHFGGLSDFFGHSHASLKALDLTVRTQLHTWSLRDAAEAQALSADSLIVHRLTTMGSLESRLNRNLTSLTIQASMSPWFALSFLQESPSLVDCDLNFQPQGRPFESVNFHRFAEVWSKERVTLSKLRRLKLANLSDDRFFHHIRVPHLKSLSISRADVDGDLGLNDCLEGSSSSLEEVDFRHLSLSDDTLQTFFQNHPCVKSISLYQLDNVDCSFLGIQPAILPKLRTLNIVGGWKQFSALTLLAFIKHRRRSRADGGSRPEATEERLKWVLFQDREDPRMFIRFDAGDPTTKVVRSIPV